MAKLYIGDSQGAPAIVKVEEVPKLKFGASVDTVIGDVVDGVLQKPTTPTALNFAGVTEIGRGALQYAFYEDTNITSVDLSSVQSVDSSGLSYAFYQSLGITGVLDLSSLQNVGSYGLNYAFYDCEGITSIDLSSLQSVGSNGLKYAFSSCSITTISFPSLTSVQTDSFKTAFQFCYRLTEIHFRADMQETVEAMSGYSSKWGATNATIYFDL